MELMRHQWLGWTGAGPSQADHHGGKDILRNDGCFHSDSQTTAGFGLIIEESCHLESVRGIQGGVGFVLDREGTHQQWDRYSVGNLRRVVPIAWFCACLIFIIDVIVMLNLSDVNHGRNSKEIVKLHIVITKGHPIKTWFIWNFNA